MIGHRLRALRKQHGMTLRDVADRSGLSVSMLSQVENEACDPSLSALRRLARVFDQSVAALFTDPEAPPVHISRPGQRTALSAPQGQVTYERLTPGRGDLEVLQAVLEPGDVSAERCWAHPSTECVVVVSGALVAEIDGLDHMVDAGEAITFDSRLPHRYRHTGDAPTHIILSVTPPTP